MATEYDIIVIGAGVSGLAFSSVYLDLHPPARLLMIEREEVLGGTWNRRRIYDHFWTQWSVGFAEFSDTPMTVPPEEDQYYGFFKAKHTSEYLEQYANTREIYGTTLNKRIRFSTLVTNAKKVDAGWKVEVVDTRTSERRTLTTAKLIVASGLTSIPKIPKLNGSDTFGAPMVHTIDFGSSNVLTDEKVEHITVLGGGKSGADMAYAGVKAGKKVSWIVRPTGTGPCAFVTAKGMGPYKSAFELASIRVAELMQPSHYGSKNKFSDLFHNTRLGQSISRKFWTSLNDEALADADYAGRPALKGFDKLTPHTEFFWQNSPAGLVNRKDFFEVIASSVEIHYDEIDTLRPQEICLKSGETIQTNALLLGTGWQNSLDYLSPSLRAELGLPYPLNASADLTSKQVSDAKHWSQLEHDADVDIVKAFPALANPPEHVHPQMTETPWRLYNLAVPVNDDNRSFACIGQMEPTNLFLTGEVQSLWVTAYFDGKVNLPSTTDRKDSVAHFIAWNRRRYLSHGDPGNSIVFDTLRYTDHLLKDLGLTSHLKKGWFARLFSPNRAENYKGLREEYIKKYPVERLRETLADMHGC